MFQRKFHSWWRYVVAGALVVTPGCAVESRGNNAFPASQEVVTWSSPTPRPDIQEDIPDQGRVLPTQILAQTVVDPTAVFSNTPVIVNPSTGELSDLHSIDIDDFPTVKDTISSPTPSSTGTATPTVARATPFSQETEQPRYQFDPVGWYAHWNEGIAQIRGEIRDTNGNPVIGSFVQARCGNTVLASNPSGINLYAPHESYPAGVYDIILSSPVSLDSMCSWEVRIVQASTYEEALYPLAPSLSPSGYCDLQWGVGSVCFANWRQNW